MKTYLLTILFLISGCTLIAPYDVKTDEGISDIHQKLTLFIYNSPTPNPKGVTPENKEFYNQINSQVKSLIVRAKAIPKNDLTVKQLNLLNNDISLLEKLDDEGYMAEETTLIQDEIDRICGAILKLELAKKRE